MRGIGLLFGLVAGLFAASAATADCGLPQGGDSARSEAVAAVNAHRRSSGRGTLTPSAKLEEAAQAHACWMARRGKLSHTGSGGSSFDRRIKAEGYCLRTAAENVAKGYPTGAAVVKGWMGSKGHRQNILNGKMQEYGIGLAAGQGRLWWVMLFAKPC